MKLTSSYIKTNLTEGRYSDGRNLYLTVNHNGAKSWVFMWVEQGRRREMGLGSFTGAGRATALGLTDARLKADEIRAGLAKGVNPIADRKRSLVGAITFEALMTQVIAKLKLEGGWKVTRGVCGQEVEWTRSLKGHAAKLMTLPVASITDDDVVAVLRPIWFTKHETAERVRFRIEQIMKHAERGGLNPARFEGHIETKVGKRLTTKGKGKKKQPSLHHDKVPAFMVSLGDRGHTVSAVAFCTLTAVRTDECRLAEWTEIDFDSKLWVIPAERMKCEAENDRGGAHAVPLSDAALDILKRQFANRVEGNPYIFPGQKAGQSLGETSLNDKITKPAGRKGGLGLQGEATMHGMRASFRTWVSSRGLDEVAAELCLAHVIGNKTTRAYDRDERLPQRAKLLQAWGDYCTGKTNVVALPVAA